MTAAISIPVNHVVGAFHNIEPFTEGTISRDGNACAPNDSMLTASLPKKNISNADVYSLPAAREDVSNLSTLSGIAAFLESQGTIDRGSSVQDNDIAQQEYTRQLCDVAVNLLAENNDSAGDAECVFLAAFCKEAYLDLHAHLSAVKFHVSDEDVKAQGIAKSTVLDAATTALSEAVKDVSNNANRLSIGARQLDQWDRDSDIGLEILRMFATTWNLIRNSMRQERQFEIGEIRRLSDLAVAALIKQGDDKFQQDTLNAWASIASAAVQLAPIGLHLASKSRTVNKNAKMKGIDVNRQALPVEAEQAKTTRKNTEAQNFNTKVMVGRALGEGTQGAINLFAADKGRDAAYDNADFTRFSNRMQAANIELENLNARGEAAWQNILQMLSSMVERQNRMYELNMRNTRA